MKSIKNTLGHWYHQTSFGRFLLFPLKILVDAIQFNYYTDKIYIRKRFKGKLGYELNLINPKTFNEKLQWLKLHDRTALHTICADKLLVRDYVTKKIGQKHVIPLLKVYDRCSDLEEQLLPDPPFVLKTNHDSGNVFIVEKTEDVDIGFIRKKLSASFRHNYYHSSREWQYKNIEPKIIAERLILDAYDNIPKDYKVHCFNGVPRFIQVDSDRFSEHKRTMYDINWNEQGFIYKYPVLKNIERPKNLQKMLDFARILSSPFPFARIDFYDTDEHLFFGEITFHPESGFGSFSPHEWDKKIGDKLKLKKTIVDI